MFTVSPGPAGAVDPPKSTFLQGQGDTQLGRRLVILFIPNELQTLTASTQQTKTPNQETAVRPSHPASSPSQLQQKPPRLLQIAQAGSSCITWPTTHQAKVLPFFEQKDKTIQAFSFTKRSFTEQKKK